MSIKSRNSWLGHGVAAQTFQPIFVTLMAGVMFDSQMYMRPPKPHQLRFPS